jgi:hypothetical protein
MAPNLAQMFVFLQFCRLVFPCTYQLSFDVAKSKQNELLQTRKKSFYYNKNVNNCDIADMHVLLKITGHRN